MRLYVVKGPDGGAAGQEIRWVGTLVDAKKAAADIRKQLDLGPRSSEVDYEEVNVPTAKGPFLKFLNDSGARPSCS